MSRESISKAMIRVNATCYGSQATPNECIYNEVCDNANTSIGSQACRYLLGIDGREKIRLEKVIENQELEEEEEVS